MYEDDKNVKKLSKSGYVWSHIAVILIHVILASLLISTYFYKKIILDSKTLVLVIGILLLLMSLGSLAPILMTNNKILIE